MITVESVTTRIQAAGIDPGLAQKWQSLLQTLAGLGSAVVAYSGGVDSSFLSYASHLALGERMLAITLHTPQETDDTIDFAASFARQAGFQHLVVEYDSLQNPNIRANPADRCYHCKQVMLGLVRRYAAEHGFKAVLEGQNADDEHDYRPGRKAVLENGALSPLAQAGFTKSEIRTLARSLGLPIWDRPSSPCLASRVPYGTPITAVVLRQIAQGEAFLQARGFSPVRVRHHTDLARIEVAPEQIERLAALHAEVTAYFKGIGFQYVSIDLQGYRQGSLNEALGL
jgi:uncharacterized protein